ncbi:MAG TPA: hypothetical protein VN862_01695 [Candidatus Acidoferrales bacterium]|nr:hypothetical protein [Candidatus Acidoferrales bacterium]
MSDGSSAKFAIPRVTEMLRLKEGRLVGTRESLWRQERMRQKTLIGSRRREAGIAVVAALTKVAAIRPNVRKAEDPIDKAALAGTMDIG